MSKMSSSKNLAAIMIICITCLLFWVLFLQTTEGQPIGLIETFKIPLYLIFVIGVFFLFLFACKVVFKEELLRILMTVLNFFGQLNACPYCLEIREETIPYLVDGFCKVCCIKICSKCFFFLKTKNQINGCPDNLCTSKTFVRDKLLAYSIHVPKKMKESLELYRLKSGK